MSWIQKLYDTYENNISQIAGSNEESISVMLPVAHTTIKAHIQVTLDADGNYLRASFIPDKEQNTMMPCSEKSAGRSGSQPYPHPLIDKIQYLAGDYNKYGGEKWHGYKLYLENLKSWAEFENTNAKVRAIYFYVSKGKLMEDLIGSQILSISEDGILDAKWDKAKYIGAPSINQLDTVIRWAVEIPGINDSTTWKDRELIDNWISYYSKTQGKLGYCYVIGKVLPLAENHPKNIYNLCANAKLISSNDNSGYTYRGRFRGADECYGISYEASQKAHNALKWLIEKQGYNKGKKSIICWSTGGHEIVSPMTDSEDIFGNKVINLNEDSLGYTSEEIAHKLKLKFSGYYSNIPELSDVVLMTVESVTDGRLSITYYQEMNHKEYINKIEKWHSECTWIHSYKFKKNEQEKSGRMNFIGAPSPIDIADTIQGIGKRNDDMLSSRTVSRILKCIMDSERIPLDIVQNAFNQTIKRINFEKAWQFDKSLSITCALYKKYLIDYKKEEIFMGLDLERNTRDYLYGRLLAVAQNIERWALDTNDESRLTNAERLMQRFSERPFSTWKNIELSLKPSIQKLGGKARGRERIIDEIMNKFEPDDFSSDRKLNGEFLLAYHCQRAAFQNIKTDKEIESI